MAAGTYWLGLQNGEISFNYHEFQKIEAALISSSNARREDFDQVKDSFAIG